MRVRLFVAVFVAMLLAPIADAKESTELMPVAEMEQLLAKGPVRGKVATVLEGTKVTEFEVLVKDSRNFGDVTIFIFTSRTHIASGMSGSPVTVKGIGGKKKLLGALAYSFGADMAVEHWGGISPLQYMHQEAGSPVPAAALPASVTYRGMTMVPIALGTEEVPESVLRSVSADPETLQILKRGRFVVSSRPVGASAAGSSGAAAEMRPGMPLMVDLIELQDASGTSTLVSATGTVTYVGPNGEVYGFGHPFLGARKVRYNFRTCRIIGTVLSNWHSFKLPGAASEVLGTIEYDGAYGIYGRLAGTDRPAVTEFSMDFSANGKPTGTYRILMATSTLTSLVMAYAFDVVGEIAKAPLPRQTTMAIVRTSVALEKYGTIETNQVFPSTRRQFGPFLFHQSSYENGYEDFMERVYIPLTVNRLGFTLGRTHLSFDFIEGEPPTLQVASVTFPQKVTWGQDPVLDILLVTEDNLATLSRCVAVPLDWSKIAEPIYTAATKDADKSSEKIVRGAVSMYTADVFSDRLSDNEKEVETPDYFLDPADYLAHLRKRLDRNNRMLYVRVAVTKRSGLEGGTVAEAAPATPASADSDPGWQVSDQHLTERKITVSEDPMARFVVDLPPVPLGYVVAEESRTLTFEVVK